MKTFTSHKLFDRNKIIRFGIISTKQISFYQVSGIRHADGDFVYRYKLCQRNRKKFQKPRSKKMLANEPRGKEQDR